MKKMGRMVVLLCMMMALTGCRMYTDYVVNGDGTVTATAMIAYTPAEAALLEDEERTELTLKTMEDGKEYYVTPKETEVASLDSFNMDTMMLTEDIFFYAHGADQKETAADTAEDEMYLQMSISLLSDIVETNANVSTDGKTAVFGYPGNKDGNWYAYTQKGKEMIARDKTAPKMKGAKNKKYYKEMPGSIHFSDNIAVRQIQLNGKVVTATQSTTMVNGEVTTKTVWYTDKKKDASKNGKNVFKVTDLNGNTATFTIYIDNKKPVIKGVKNNKTYKNKVAIYVKDAKKLSTVTINGKKQKVTNRQLVKKGKYKGYYKYVVKKRGTNKIVVKDAAGNKASMKIRIAK